ncbi:MAG: glycoside hydrolase family 97 N-terminal domain-containing protein [Rikenellaceae bacterium]
MKFIAILALATLPFAADAKSYTMRSPDRRLELTVDVGAELRYSLKRDRDVLIAPSPISISLGNGQVLGHRALVQSIERESERDVIQPSINHRSPIKEHYNEITFEFKGDYEVEFRLYNEALAYHFETDFDEDIVVIDEQATFLLPYDSHFWINALGTEADANSISTYEIDKSLYLPIFVERRGGGKIVIRESNSGNYPRMTLSPQANPLGFISHFAPFQYYIKDGDYELPWRIVEVVDRDLDLLDSSIMYKLED